MYSDLHISINHLEIEIKAEAPPKHKRAKKMIQKLKNIGSCNHKIFRNLIFNTAHGCAINCLKPFTAEEKDLL